MFMKCTALVGGKGTAYDENHVDAEYAVIDGQYETGYFTEKIEYLPIQFNGTPIESVRFNGFFVDGVYVNGVQIFRKNGNIQDS